MTEQGREWAVPGATLRGRMRGAAPTAVFLHGFGGSQEDWEPIWQALPTAIEAIRYDLRGFGESRAEDEGPFSHADDLLALLDNEGIGRADLIGMSMGGSVAVGFALDHPGRVRRLVLVSPGLMGWDWSEEWRALWRAITASARAGDIEGARALWAAHPLFATVRGRPDALAALYGSIARYSGAEWIVDRQRPSLPDVERLPLLSCPTLLLSGALDMPDFRLIGDLIEGSAADVRRVDVAGCGHMLTLEAVEICAEAIGVFLT